MNTTQTETDVTFDPTQLTRPDDALLRYYLIAAAMTLIGFPFVFLPLYFKYHTLKYKFDDKGVSMSWGLLFRREIYLTYRRIQDIHVTRNLVQRWLGLASVSVQTASGSSGAEMVIEGLLNPEALRNYLYSQMRGSSHETDPGESQTIKTPATLTTETTPQSTETPIDDDQMLTLLKQIRDEVHRLSAQNITTIPDESSYIQHTHPTSVTGIIDPQQNQGIDGGES